MKNVSMANISVDFKGMVRKWINFTHPFHNLTGQEQEVLSQILIEYFIFKRTIDNEEVVWKMVFDYDTRLRIKEELKIKDYTFQNMLTKLRHKGVLKDKRIKKNFIPNVTKDAKNFKLVYNFIIKNDIEQEKKKETA